MRCTTLLASLLVLTACGAPAAQSAATTPTSTSETGHVEADGRKRDMGRVKEAIGQMNQAIDAREKEVQHAFDVAIGKADPMKTKKKTPAADLVTFLRSKKLRLGLGKGTHSRRETFMLDETAKTDFNYGIGKNLSSDQRREVMDKYDELEMHLEESHNVVEGTAGDLLDLNMGVMLGVGTMYADRHKHGFDFDDTDYAIIADFIAAQRRVEQLSALSTGLMTGYHAVVRDGKDPKVLGQYVAEASKGFPTTGVATTDDAKAYVASLKRDVTGSKERYEGWIKDLHGPENFGSYKAGIDGNFDKIQALMSTETGAKTAAAPPPSQATTQGGSGAAAARPGLPGNATVDTVKRGVTAVANGDVAGAVGAAADLLPIDGRAKTAMKGIAALATGDLKGAIGAATSMVPDGPLKKGLSIVASLFG